MRSRRAYLAAVALMVGAMIALSGLASAATPTQILQRPPFPPTDVSLFDPGLYPGGPAMVPAAQNPSGEMAMRDKLKALLVKRFGSGSKQVSQGLAKYDAAATKEIVSSPRLRAALVALKGTIGEPAINGVLTKFGQVRFGDTINNAIAQSEPPPLGSGDKKFITFNKRYQYEDIRLIASTLVHEALHQDLTNSNKEELVNNSIDTLAHAQFVLESPSLATSGTELARSNNSEILARLNTRDANGKLRLFTSQGNIFPESNIFVPYIAAPFEPLGDSTPGNATLKGVVRNVVGPSVTLPKTVNFDDNTVLLLDSKQKVFTNAELVELAKILKLDTSPQAAQRAQEAEKRVSNRPIPGYEKVFGAK